MVNNGEERNEEKREERKETKEEMRINKLAEVSFLLPFFAFFGAHSWELSSEV